MQTYISLTPRPRPKSAGSASMHHAQQGLLRRIARGLALTDLVRVFPARGGSGRFCLERSMLLRKKRHAHAADEYATRGVPQGRRPLVLAP